MVKADAYGLGAEPIAGSLWRAGARAFFVARVDEGVALRQVLSEARILVLDGLALGGAAECIHHALEPVLNQPGELAAWRDCARRVGRALPASLHVDTGLWRLGFSARQLDGLQADAFDGVRLQLLLSHLACADEPAHPLNVLQRERFRAIRRRFPQLPGSLVASSGMFLGPDYLAQLCRPGLALFGGNPTPHDPNPMQPVVTVTAPIVQLHEVDAPGSVGYGAAHRVLPGSRLATLPLGYADGLPRLAGGKARLRVADVDVPVVGRVSMDLLTIDVTQLPPDRTRPGNPVVVIGGPDGLERLAEASGTLAYEILTRLGRRFARRYVGEVEP